MVKLVRICTLCVGKAILVLKSCPKCKGDVHTNRDRFGCYKQCLQCGLMEDVECRSTFKHLESDSSKEK